MKYGAVITATGITERTRQFKQLMKLDISGIAERVIVNFMRAGVKDIVMVTGYNAEKLERRLRDFDITFIRNDDYASSQMLDSAKLGIGELAGRCERIFFCPVDVPFFTDRTVEEEMAMMDADPDIRVIVPAYNGRGGHPLLIDGRVLPDILAYNGDRGMKGAYESLPAGSVARIEVSDRGAVTAAEKADNYRLLVDMHNESILHPLLKLSFASTTGFFGPGTVQLIREVDKCGNVRDACEKCGFSYSKGWTILRRCEEKFGYAVVERQPGGRDGGSAYVTDKGRDLLAVYEKLQVELEALAETRFRELMDEYRLAGDTTDQI